MKRFALGLLFALWSSLAFAQGCGPQNPNCIVPTAPLGTSNNQAASTAFVQSTASNPIAPLLINPTANSFIQGFVVTQSLSGTQATGNLIANRINITSDNSVVTSLTGIGTALEIDYNVGGSGLTGARTAIQATTTLTANSNAGNNRNFYVGGKFQALGQVADVGGLGQFFGVNAVCGVNASLGTFGECTGAENDVLVPTGSTALIKTGFKAISIAGDATQGSQYDAAFAAFCQTGGVCWKNAFLVASQAGLGGVATAGTILKTQDSFTVANVIDTSSATVTGNWLNFLGASAGITGSWNGANANIAATSSVTSSPGFNLTNTTNDATGPSSIFQKNRASGNTLSADTLGSIVVQGWANGAQRPAADLMFSQGAAVSGNNVPGKFTILISSSTTVFGNSLSFDNNAHLSFSGSQPTNNACTGFALATGSSDVAGKVTFTSATSCAINFGATFANAPFCNVTPGTAATPSTVDVTTTTGVLTANFTTAQTAMSWVCVGA